MCCGKKFQKINFANTFNINSNILNDNFISPSLPPLGLQVIPAALAITYYCVLKCLPWKTSRNLTPLDSPVKELERYSLLLMRKKTKLTGYWSLRLLAGEVNLLRLYLCIIEAEYMYLHLLKGRKIWRGWSSILAQIYNIFSVFFGLVMWWPHDSHVFFFADDEFPLLLEGADANSRPLPEGIYNVPRNLFLDEALYDEPPTELTDPSSVPPARGLYDVPRAILGMYMH